MMNIVSKILLCKLKQDNPIVFHAREILIPEIEDRWNVTSFCRPADILFTKHSIVEALL